MGGGKNNSQEKTKALLCSLEVLFSTELLCSSSGQLFFFLFPRLLTELSDPLQEAGKTGPPTPK